MNYMLYTGVAKNNKLNMRTIEKIYDLEPEETELLFSETIDDQCIEVRQWQHYRWLNMGGEFIQTLIDLNNVEQILLPNLKAMLTVLLLSSSPKRLLSLGLGGASFERYFYKKRPEINVTSIEANEDIIQLAKDYFYLPDYIDCVHDTAEHYVSVCDIQYEIVLCDIFANEKQPDCIYDENFYANIHRCLTVDGVLAINLVPESEQDVIDILLPIKQRFENISLYVVPDHMNIVIFVSNKKLPDVDELNTRAEQLFKSDGLDLRGVPERINRILETI